MIKNHGYKTVQVSKIKAPGDIAKLRRSPHTSEIAESLVSTGGKPIDPIVLNYATGELLAGRHRFAAALNEGIKSVDVLLLEGTKEELEQACLVEQIKRRRPTDAEIARLLELVHPAKEQTFPDVDDEDEETRKEASPRRKREAIEHVAALVGRTPAAVKQAEHRARHEDGTPPRNATAECIDSMGLTVPADVHADAWAEAQFLTGVEKTLVKLQGDCSRHAHPYQQLYEAIHVAAAMTRSQAPKSVCPHCKLTSQRRGCLACRGRGWLRESEMANIPAQLMETGDKAGIYVDGKWTPLKEVRR